MSNRNARILAAGGAAVLVAALGSPAALAAPTATTWTVQPGGAITATSGSLTLTNPPGGSLSDTCTSSTMSGTLKAGSGLPGPGIGSISMAAFRGCGHIASQDLKARGLPWHLNAASYNPGSGTTHGTITGLHADLEGPSCSLIIDGTGASKDNGIVSVTYSNAKHALTWLKGGSGNLHFYKVVGCAGFFGSGDPANLAGTFGVSPQQTITSP